MIDKTKGISIGLLITIIPLAAGAALWYDGRQDDEHVEIEVAFAAEDASIRSELYASNVELTLQQINLELKLLRTIEERRPLTADEEDRRAYLIALREIVVAEQKKRIA